MLIAARGIGLGASAPVDVEQGQQGQQSIK